MRCRPLFEALSDFKGEPAWQCVALPQEGPQQVDPQTAVSEGWAIRFDVTEGPDAAPWWWWSRLEKFWIDGNFAYGRLPERMGELWPNMRTLDLYSNSLEGGIPASFGLMRKLHQVQLQHNRLSGRIPEKLFHPDTLPVLSVLLLCWVMVPHGGATDVLGACVLLLVLLVVLLHICRRSLLPGQGWR